MGNKLPGILQENNVPGCAIGVFDKNSKYFEGRGVRKKNFTVNENTSFRVASLTKPVFSYFVLKLCDEGLIDLDMPLIEYFGEKYIENEMINEVTTRHVLSHQTGFPNWAHSSPLDFEFKPGDHFQYSGEGIVYLQKTIERMTGKHLQRLMDRYVFAPLNMRSSAMAPIFLSTENYADPHDENGMKSEQKHELSSEIIDYVNRMPRPSNAAGTMWSSIVDYTTFLHHLLFSEDPVVRNIFDLMTETQVYHQPWNVSWGLGIGLQHIEATTSMWHWGSDNGFKTFTFTDLKEQYGITIFTNGENGFNVYAEILEEVLPDLPEYIKYQNSRRNEL